MANPASQEMLKSRTAPAKSLHDWVGSLSVTTPAAPRAIPRPATDCLRSSRRPNRNAEARTLRNVASVNVTRRPSTNDSVAPITKTAAGAPNGNRRHQKRGTIMTASSGTVIQSEVVGAPSLFRRTINSTAFSTMAAATSSANQ